MAIPLIGALVSAGKAIITKALPYVIEAGKALLPVVVDKFIDWFSGDAKENLTSELSQSESFDAQKASIAEIQQIRGIISQYKNTSLQKIDDWTGQIIDGFFEKVFSDFGALFGEIDENIAKDMRSGANYHFGKAKENLRQNIMSQISFDNELLAEILRDDSGEGKKQRVDKFIDLVNANALREFQNELENSLNAIFELAKQKLNGKLLGIKSSAEKSVRFLEDYQNSLDKKAKEAQQITLAKSIAIDSAMLKAIG